MGVEKQHVARGKKYLSEGGGDKCRFWTEIKTAVKIPNLFARSDITFKINFNTLMISKNFVLNTKKF
jgi:hypothetical protein